MPMETINERLDLFEEFGATVTYSFPQNKYIRTGTQSEDIIIPHRYPIASIDLSKSWFDNDFSEYLSSFFNQVKGTQKGFRFRDPLDWEATKDPLVVNGTSTQGKLAPPPNGSTTEFQLFKVYKIGTEAENWRPITRPNASNFFVYVNGVAATFSLNTSTGIVTLNSPPANGATLTWKGTFDIPVRFEVDEGLPLQTIVHQPEDATGKTGGVTLFSVPSLKLIEIKEAHIPYQPTTFANELTHEFAIDLSYDSNLTRNYYGQKESLDSGFETIKSQAKYGNAKLTLGSQLLLYGDDINYLITIFRCSMGASSFLLSNDYADLSIGRSRLSETVGIKVERDSTSRQEQVFRVSNCELVETAPPLYHVFGTFYAKGGPYSSGEFICNGACNQSLYFRTIDPVPLPISPVFVVEPNGLWYFKDQGDDLYLVDFIYSNNYFARDMGDTRGYPEGPFSPHGIGITYVSQASACIQGGLESTAYGDSLEITDIIRKA